MTSCSKSPEDRAVCLVSAVFVDIGIPLERLFRLTDKANALRDALNARLAWKGR